MWYRGGKLTSVNKVPLNVLEALMKQSEVNDEDLQQPAIQEDRVCLFCGGPAEWQRQITGQPVDLCEQHYYSENVGRITARLRSTHAQENAS